MCSIKDQIKIYFFIIVVLCFQGCVIEKKPRVVGDDLNVVNKQLIPFKSIEKRIEKSRKILEKNNIPKNKKETAASLLELYRKISMLNNKNISDSEYKKLINRLFDHLGIIEEQYFYIASASDRETKINVINDYLLMKKQISENFLVGNYKSVISLCVEFESQYGNGSLTPEIGLLFSLSLAQNNKLPEALSIGKKIIKDMELIPDLIQLTNNIIKWELEMGNRENAQSFYEKLFDTINEKNALFKESRNLLSEYEKGNDFEKLTDKYASEINNSRDPAVEENLKRVENFIEKEDFTEARRFLLRWRMRAEEGPELNLIDQAFKTVDAAEENSKKKSSNNKIKLDEANNLIEKEKYEDAIKLLESIDSENPDPEVKKLKKIAKEKLIDFKMTKAAVLFNRARDKSDFDEKKILLLSSKDILVNLINAYPDSPLIEKIKKFLGYVNKELENLPE